MGTPSEEEPMRTHVFTGLLLLLTGIGVWAGIDLTMEHYRVLTDPEHESWCTIEESNFDCAAVSQSKWSEHQVFLFERPLPTSVPPVGFFVGLLALVALGRFRRGDEHYPAAQARDDTLALAWLLLLPAATVDLLLVYVMKFVLQTWCIVCLGIDVTTALLIVLIPFARSAGWRGLFRSGLAGALRHTNWLVFGCIFAVVVIGTQRAYSTALVNANVRAMAEIIVWFEEQPPVEIPLPADVPYLGEPGAPFQVVEYADFQCPYCAVASANIHHLMEAYPDQIHFAFRHFPLGSDCNPYNSNNMHPDACMAAQAAECAAQHGEFWNMYNGLYTLFAHAAAERKRPTTEHVRSLAHELDIPASEFYYCLEEEGIREQVVAMVEEGKAAGVRGTPALFVNGVLLPGGANAATHLEVLIRAHLQQQGVDPGEPITFEF